jgi:hypothetical protein
MVGRHMDLAGAARGFKLLGARHALRYHRAPSSSSYPGTLCSDPRTKQATSCPSAVVSVGRAPRKPSCSIGCGAGRLPCIPRSSMAPGHSAASAWGRGGRGCGRAGGIADRRRQPAPRRDPPAPRQAAGRRGRFRSVQPLARDPHRSAHRVRPRTRADPDRVPRPAGKPRALPTHAHPPLT